MKVDAHKTSKLAVILHADIVGSTELVQRNESTAHFVFNSLFRRFTDTIESYGGATRELRGDALVAEFERASDAVSAALAFQQQNAKANALSTEPIKPEMRVGISLGEVVIADGTITGGGVVMAQRLEQLADPGGVCIQGAIQETVPRRLPIIYQSLGEQTLKGFSEPVRAFIANLDASGTPPPPDPVRTLNNSGKSGRRSRAVWIALLAGAVAVAGGTGFFARTSSNDSPDGHASPTSIANEKPSIAVMPFENLSGDDTQEYISDGLTQNIITALSQVPDTVVIARNSTFAYKGSTVTPTQVAEELNVRYVVEGSFHREGDEVRIHAQFVDARNSRELWAERFDRTFAGIFALHDDITTNVVSALEIKLTKEVQDRIARLYTQNVEAYDIFLKGQAALFRFNKADNALAVDLFTQAIELDPDFSLGHGSLSLAYTFAYRLNWADDAKTALDKGLSSSQRAVQANDKIPQSHFALSQAHAYRGELELGLAAVNKAISLDSNYADAYALRAMVQTFAGATSDSIESIDTAMRLNPRSNAVYNMIRGRALYFADRLDEAKPELQEAVSRNPNYLLSHVYLALTLSGLGQVDDAVWQADEIIALDPDFSIAGWTDGEILSNPEYVRRVNDGLRAIGLPE